MADENEEETPEMATKEQPSEERDNKLKTEVLSHNPVESREDLVYTAVSFLQNPKVRDGSVAHKKAFLRKKGLTEEEISNAFIRSGTAEHVSQPMAPYSLPPPLPPPPPIMQTPVVTSWMRIRETMVAGVLVWGVSKAASKLYTEYIAPYFDLKWPQERRLEVIENSVLEMQNNLVETMKKVQEVVATVQHQQKQMLALTEQLVKNMPSSSSISLHHNDQAANEIKTELNSIKGILLSRKQFPTAPNTSASLPTWQLSASLPAVDAATPQAPVTENKLGKIPNNDLDTLSSSSSSPPPPTLSLSNQVSTDIEESSTSERMISIEDNKEVDNPNYSLANGKSAELREVEKQSSKKSKIKNSNKKNNNNVNGFSAE